MRVVLVTVGSRGDVVPFLALAERLAAEGHRAVVVTHASLLPAHPVDGVEFVPVDSDPARLLTGPAARALQRGDLRGLNRTRRVFADFVTSVAGPTAGSLDGADVVLASAFAMAAVTVARDRGVPVVRAQLWPERAVLEGPMPVLPYAWALPARARRLARWGLRRTEPLLAGFDGWWSGGKLHIVPHHRVGFTTNDLGSLHAYSPALVPSTAADDLQDSHDADAGGGAPHAAHVTGWWTGGDGGTLSAATAEVLDRPGAPWMYLGFGSMPQRSPAAVLAMLEHACRANGLRAVVQMRGADRPGAGSPVHVIGPEPHSALLPRMTLAVHHGGSGTTGAVVRAGIPSVVVPHVADQFYWAHRLHATGVAPRGLPRPLLSARRLVRSVAAASDPARVRAARTLGERVRAEDGTGAAVRRLESLVGCGV